MIAAANFVVLFNRKSQNDVAVPDIFVEEAEDPLRVATINIYILNFSSPILMLIRCAWDNLLIVSSERVIFIHKSHGDSFKSFFLRRVGVWKCLIVVLRIRCPVIEIITMLMCLS